MKIVNLTPHEIVVLSQGIEVRYPPTSPSARVIVERRHISTIQDGDTVIPVYGQIFGKVENVPPPRDGTMYIVSAMVLSALKLDPLHHDDVVAPDTSPEGAIRDADGKIVAVKGFVY